MPGTFIVCAILCTAAGTNHPAEFGTGYESWSTRGGATLGSGNGARAQLTAGGGGLWGGYGNFSLEGAYIWGINKNFDLALGGRVPLWPFGLSPGVDFRPRLVNKGRFQLALDISVFTPMYFTGYYYSYYFTPLPPAFPGGAARFFFGLSAEPGLMMSYFIRDCMELYWGIVLPLTVRFTPSPVAVDFGWVNRIGFAFNFKKQNVGVFANFDFGPRFFFPYYSFWAAFQAGAQFRFGGS